MNPRLAYFLVRLYTSSWRKRYGAEFTALLESGSSGLRTSANIGWSALSERIVSTPGLTIDQSAGSVQFRSWCVQAPWATFGLGSCFLLAGAYLIALFMLWSGWQILLREANTPFRGPMHGFENIYFQAVSFFYFGAPILIGWAIGVVTARQRAKAVWPSIGLVLIAFAAVLNQVHANRTKRKMEILALRKTELVPAPPQAPTPAQAPPNNSVQAALPLFHLPVVKREGFAWDASQEIE